jgi:hypothetical protein
MQPLSTSQPRSLRLPWFGWRLRGIARGIGPPKHYVYDRDVGWVGGDGLKIAEELRLRRFRIDRGPRKVLLQRLPDAIALKKVIFD